MVLTSNRGVKHILVLSLLKPINHFNLYTNHTKFETEKNHKFTVFTEPMPNHLYTPLSTSNLFDCYLLFTNCLKN